MKNRLIEQLRRDEPALGFRLMYPNPDSIVRPAPGRDRVWIDAGHGILEYHDILRGVQAAEPCGLPSITRGPACEPGGIGRVLDTATNGVMVPQVESAGETRAAAEAAKFPPPGRRSYGGGRVIDIQGRDYWRRANEEIIVAAQIEYPGAVERAGEIAAAEGIDALFFGGGDMEIRSGAPIDPPVHESPELLDAMRRVVAAAREAGKTAGCIAAEPNILELAVSMGYRLIAGTADVILLAHGSAAAVERLREALGTHEGTRQTCP